MRNAAAPSVGGTMIAPMPPEERIAPATCGGYPARFNSGQATDPSVTVVATPLPDTVPRRRLASVVARPGLAPLVPRIALIAHSRKNAPAPERCSTAP